MWSYPQNAKFSLGQMFISFARTKPRPALMRQKPDIIMNYRVLLNRAPSLEFF
jgi:hypothetical protein